MNAKQEQTTQPPLTDEEVEKLLRRAQQGDPDCEVELSKLLDDSPHLWLSYGNLRNEVHRQWIKLII